MMYVLKFLDLKPHHRVRRIMRICSVIFSIIFTATNAHAYVTATFQCEIISATLNSISEGKKEFSGNVLDFVGNRIRFKITAQPHQSMKTFYQIDMSSQSDGPHKFFNERGPTLSYQINAEGDYTVGGGEHGGFALDTDEVTFFTSTGRFVKLTRYDGFDYEGLMVQGGFGYVSTLGLDCQSSDYDAAYFANFHYSWGE